MKILLQIFIVFLISSLVGYSFQNIFGFVEAFLVTTVIQLITPSIYQSLSRSKARILVLEDEINEFVDISTCSVPCPCGGYTFNEIVVVSEDSVIANCPVCNNEYKLTPIVRVVLTTEPLNLGKSYEDKEVVEEQE
tara:strand:+ start:2925 stop:3332 length:408 start_codon:yes stop_codon:yes gene_type:complete